MWEWSSGFPCFLQFKSDFCHKAFMVWATVSSRSCFCWHYRPSPEKAMATHSSTLAWKIPWTEEPSRLQSMGRKESDRTERLHFHALEKEMATHSSILAWRVPGSGEPGGLPSLGLHRVGHDWSDLAAAVALIRIKNQAASSKNNANVFAELSFKSCQLFIVMFLGPIRKYLYWTTLTLLLRCVLCMFQAYPKIEG